MSPSRKLTVMKEPFQKQLKSLLAMDISNWENLEFDDEDGQVTSIQVFQAGTNVDHILHYLEYAQTVLIELEIGDDAEWIYAGKQTVVRIGSTIMTAGDAMEKLMKIVERAREFGCIDDCEQEKICENVYLDIVEKLEAAIAMWHEIVKLVTDVRKQVDIASEWVELHDEILNEVQVELRVCMEKLFEIQEKRHFSMDSPSGPNGHPINLEKLKMVMDESPGFDRPKLPNLSEEEKSINSIFIDVTTRIKPLHASLQFLPIRIDQYINRANGLFPMCTIKLKNKYDSLQKQYCKLQKNIEHLEKEVGEDRWTDIFRSTGQQALEMFDNWERNLDSIAQERSKAQPNRTHIERLITRNAYLMPAVNKITRLINRAIEDRYTVNGELLILRSKLHNRWEELLSRTSNEQVDAIPESPSLKYARNNTISDSAASHSFDMNGDPDISSVSTSNRTSTSIEDSSSLTSVSSPESPVAVGSQLSIGKLKHIPFQLRPLNRVRNNTIGTVSGVEELEVKNEQLAPSLLPSLPEARKKRESLLPQPSPSLSMGNQFERRNLNKANQDMKPGLSHIPVLSPQRRRQSLQPIKAVASPGLTPNCRNGMKKSITGISAGKSELHLNVQNSNQVFTPKIQGSAHSTNRRNSIPGHNILETPSRLPRPTSRLENNMFAVPKLRHSLIQPTPPKTTTAVRVVSVSSLGTSNHKYSNLSPARYSSSGKPSKPYIGTAKRNFSGPASTLASTKPAWS